MRAVFNMEWNKHVPLPPKKRISNEVIIETIKDSISLVTDMSFLHYDVKSRRRNIVFLRFAFFRLARTYSNFTYDEIGGLFYSKFDHSTIIHGCEAIDNIEFLGSKDERFQLWDEINNKFKTLIKYK